MKQFVENNVKTAVRSYLVENGLQATIDQSYTAFDCNLDDVLIPKIKAQSEDENIIAQLRSECESIAKSTFSNIMLDLITAQSIIYAAVYEV